MLAPPQARRSEPGGWRPRRAVDMDSNASRAGEVERKVWRDNDFLLPGKLLKMSPLGDGQSAVSTQRKWGSGAVSLLALEQLAGFTGGRATAIRATCGCGVGAAGSLHGARSTRIASGSGSR